jgi:hypothetical protein
MRMRVRLVLLAAGLIISADGVRANVITLTVGPGGNYSTISAATGAETSGNTYVIIVTPGTYTNDFPVITQPTTIETATPGSQVVLSATEALPNEKGIILNNSSLTVNGLTFEEAEIDNSLGGNGAGVRDQSTGTTSLIVKNSTFMNNQEGILTGNNFAETVQILNSQFIGNGNPTDPNGQEHALYVNDALSLLVNNSLFCDTALGHDVKSRALSTTVENSQLYVGTAGPGCAGGTTSLAIDAPNGGQLDISNDQIFQGDANQNGAMVSYGEEGVPANYAESFAVSDTSFDNLGTRSSTGIQQLTNGVPTCLAPVQMSNNSFTNVKTPVNPPGCVATPSVPEPQSLWLLLTALGCCAGFFARAAHLQGRVKKSDTPSSCGGAFAGRPFVDTMPRGTPNKRSRGERVVTPSG